MSGKASPPGPVGCVVGVGGCGKGVGMGRKVGVGTLAFARLRLGCGPDHPLSSRKEYVLRPMKKAELEIAAEMIGDAGDAVELLLTKGIEPAMTKYNRRERQQGEDAAT